MSMCLQVNELLSLWKGVTCFDCTVNESFLLRAQLLISSADLPGKRGCMHCTIQGEKLFHRIVFGQYRRYLPLDSAIRNDPAFGNPEIRPAPNLRGHDHSQISLDLRLMSTRARKQIKSSMGIFDSCALLLLPYWDMTRRTMLDAMHVGKGSADILCT